MDLTFTSVDTSFQISVEIRPDELFENLESFFGNLQLLLILGVSSSYLTLPQ